MMPTCECNHHRKDHEGSKNKNNKYVDNCKVKECHCIKYHPNKQTIEKRNHYFMKISLYVLATAIFAVIAFVGTSSLIDNFTKSLDEQYTITKKSTLYDKFENGTMKPHLIESSEKSLTPTEEISTYLKMGSGFGIFIAAYVILLVSIPSMESLEKKDESE